MFQEVCVSNLFGLVWFRFLFFVEKGNDEFDGEKKFEFEIVTPERKRGWMFATKTDAERQVKEIF